MQIAFLDIFGASLEYKQNEHPLSGVINVFSSKLKGIVVVVRKLKPSACFLNHNNYT